VCGYRNVAHSDMPEEGRLSDTIATNNATTPAVCEREGRHRTTMKLDWVVGEENRTEYGLSQRRR
jgi:hypothetical protein